MAANLVPPHALARPEQPSDLDGWDAKDLEEWLPPAVRAVVAGEEQLDQARVSCGLVLYRLRVEVRDKLYGEALDRIAREAGVTTRTLNNWRDLAEKRFQLGPPDKRSAGRRKQLETDRLRKEDEERKRLPLPPGEQDEDKRAAGGLAAPAEVGGKPPAKVGTGAKPAPLPKPTTQEDYTRLVSLITTAGPSILAKSVTREQLVRAQRTIADALRLAPVSTTNRPVASTTTNTSRSDVTPIPKKEKK